MRSLKVKLFALKDFMKENPTYGQVDQKSARNFVLKQKTTLAMH